MDDEHVQEHFDDNTQVFIVRLWVERRLNRALPVVWRGVIEHVASGERRSFQQLQAITNFIQRYLPNTAPPASRRQRLKQWLVHYFR